MRRVRISIDGMSCSSCSGTIERALSHFPGVSEASVSLSTNMATFMVGVAVDTQSIVNEIESLGFDASVIEESLIIETPATERLRMAQISIDGMTCVSCSSTIERALQGLPGVTSAVVSLSMNTATVYFADGGTGSLDRIVGAIEDVGFGASVVEDAVVDVCLGGSSAASKEQQQEQQRRMLLVIDQPTSKSKSGLQPVSADRIIAALASVSGVSDVSLVSDGGTQVYGDDRSMHIRVTIDENIVGPRALVAAVQDVSPDQCLGVTVSSFGGFMQAGRLSSQHAHEQQRQWRAVLVSCLFTIPLLVITMLLPLFPAAAEALQHPVARGLSAEGLLLFLLATPVQFYVGRGFHIKAYKSLRAGSLGMDFLISTGTFAAYIYSLISLIQGVISGDTAAGDNIEFFETSAVLITVVIIGKYLEVYTKGITANAINQLSSLRAQTARLVREEGILSRGAAGTQGTAAGILPPIGIKPISGCAGGSGSGSSGSSGDRVIDASLVQKGDVLRLVEGESIAADGILQTSSLGVDESMMTGESRIVSKKIGDKLYGGSIVVEGSGEMLVTACGDSSALGRILSTVQEAQSSKPPIQEVADRIAQYFVPVVAGLSLTTFAVWMAAGFIGLVPPAWFNENDGNGSMTLFSFMFALSVWVSACPCAFGLATPTAILVATGIAAKQGILIRKGAALQFAAEVNTAVFDKTGTLTHGNMQVTDFILFECTRDVADARYVTCGLSCDKVPGVGVSGRRGQLGHQQGGGAAKSSNNDTTKSGPCCCNKKKAKGGDSNSQQDRTDSLSQVNAPAPSCCGSGSGTSNTTTTTPSLTITTTNTPTSSSDQREAAEAVAAGEGGSRLESIVIGCVDCTCALKEEREEDGGGDVIQVSLEDILWLVLTAETQSSHPLAKSITEYCRRRLQTIRRPPPPSPSSSSSSSSTTSTSSTSELYHGRTHEAVASEVLRRCSIQVVPGQGISVSIEPPPPPPPADTTTTFEDQATATTTATTATLWNTKCSIMVGNLELVTSQGLVLTKKAADVANSLRAGGKVVVFVSINGTLRALIGVSDIVREEAAAVIASLHQQGIRCYMITGDEQTTALAIGSALGLPHSHIFSNAKPEDKDAFISKLQQRGGKVVFIGDGTNDSPALARADVGIAMAGGTDIAIESGDMVLCKGHLGSLVTALDLSRRTLWRIKMNFFWALAYNAVLIPVSAGVLFPYYHFALEPMLAGGAMALSSVSIVLSSLMLMLYKPPNIQSSSLKSPTSLTNRKSDVNAIDIDSESVALCRCPASMAPVLPPHNPTTLIENLTRVLFAPFAAFGGVFPQEHSYTSVSSTRYPSDDWGSFTEHQAETVSLHRAFIGDVESSSSSASSTAAANNHKHHQSPYGSVGETVATVSNNLQRFLLSTESDESYNVRTASYSNPGSNHVSSSSSSGCECGKGNCRCMANCTCSSSYLP